MTVPSLPRYRLQKPKPAKVPVEDAELSELQRRLQERRSQRMERVKTAQKVSAITMPIQQADNKVRGISTAGGQ